MARNKIPIWKYGDIKVKTSTREEIFLFLSMFNHGDYPHNVKVNFKNKNLEPTQRDIAEFFKRSNQNISHYMGKDRGTLMDHLLPEPIPEPILEGPKKYYYLSERKETQEELREVYKQVIKKINKGVVEKSLNSDPQRAYEIFSELLKMCPELKEVENNMSIALYNMGKKDEAKKCFLELIDRYKNYLTGWKNLKVLAIETKDKVLEKKCSMRIDELEVPGPKVVKLDQYLEEI